MIVCKTAVSWGTWLANLRSLGSCVLETQDTPLKQHASLLTFEMAVDHPMICLPASFFHQMFQQSTRKTHEGWIIHKSLQIVRLAIRDQCSWLWDLEIITKHAWLHCQGKGHNCSNHKNQKYKNTNAIWSSLPSLPGSIARASSFKCFVHNCSFSCSLAGLPTVFFFGGLELNHN